MAQASQVTATIMEHIVETVQILPNGPVLVISGDPYQTQPIATVQGKTTMVKSIYHRNDLLSIFRAYKLITNHRTSDEKLLNFLSVSLIYK